MTRISRIRQGESSASIRAIRGANSLNRIAMKCNLLFAALLALLLPPNGVVAQSGLPLKFDFGSGTVAQSYTQVLPTHVYSKETGFGFEPGTKIEAVNRGDNDALGGDFCTSDQPFFFS